MSDSGSDSPAPARKSGRARKPVQRLSEGHRSKGSKADRDGRDSSEEPEDEEEEEQEEEDDAEEEVVEGKSSSDDEEAFVVTKRKSRAKASAAKENQSSGAKKNAKSAPKRKRAKKQLQDDEDAEADAPIAAAGKGKGDAVISNDNSLFNAVKNPNTSLQTTVDDWIESYQNDEGKAMAELINFVLRSCGCNSTVDEHQAVDEDGIVEVLDDIDTEFKSLTLLAYPLVSKAKPLKKFRTSLASFLTRLFAATATAELLYDTNFCQTFQAWLTSLSSSKIRSFRHTATVVCLISVTALCDVAVAVNKEFSIASRAKETEEKKGKKDTARLKEMKKNVKAVHARKTQLEEFLSELFEAVFVHRYRDSESLIRAECIKSLGAWMKSYPDYWLEGNYLRYIGWVLSDDNKDVRQEAVKALISLYARDDNISSMQHFTERFKAQLVRMATGEIDVSVRISCIHVLRAIDHHGLLDADQRDQAAALIFEEEKRVREGIAGFFAGLLEEEIKDIETEVQAAHGRSKAKGKKATQAKERLRFKCLAKLLVKYGKQLDQSTGEERDDVEVDEDDETAVEEARLSKMDADIVRTHRGRIAFTVEALWDSVEAVQDWQGIIDYLLLDHSRHHVAEESDTDEDGTPNARNKNSKGKGKKAMNVDDDAEAAEDDLEAESRLSEEEETILIEVLVAILSKATGSTATTKKEKQRDDTIQANITRAVIEALPRLFAKNQTVPTRMVDILSIPRLIKLELYLDMQMISAFESLWDDVTKQFLKHTHADVTDQAVSTIRHFLATPALGNSNATKVADLEESLLASLRDAVVDRDLETSTFVGDETLALTGWVGRIAKLYAVRDISLSLEDTDGDAHDSAFKIIDSLSERGHLGYKSEALMVQHSLTILFLHHSWAIVRLKRSKDEGPEAAELTVVRERCTSLLQRLEEFSVGAGSNPAESVKQASLSLLLNLYLLSNGATSLKSDPHQYLSSLTLVCRDELQARCAGFVEAEIDRYAQTIAAAEAEEVDEEADEEESGESEKDGAGSDDDDDDPRATGKSKKKNQKKSTKTLKTKSQKTKPVTSLHVANMKKLAELLTAEHFDRTIAPFVRAMHNQVFDLRHASVILAHFDRFGPVFDQWARILAHDLKNDAIHANKADEVARIIVQSFKEASELYLSDADRVDENILGLAKLLASATFTRTAQLKEQISDDAQVRIHSDISDFILAKIAGYDKSSQKEKRVRATILFKALSTLLTSVEGKAAIRIKNAFDASVEKSGVVINASSKLYEPLRSYQKRLVTAAAKDPSIKSAAQAKLAKQKGKGKALAKDSDEEEDEEEDQIEDGDRTPVPATSKAKAAPRARRVTAAERKVIDAAEEENAMLPPRRKSAKQVVQARDDQEDELMDDPIEDPMEDNTARQQQDDDEEEEEEEEEVEQLLRSNGKKRAISEVVEDEIENAAEVDAPAPEDDAEENGFPQPPSSSVSVSDMKRKKKKAKRG